MRTGEAEDEVKELEYSSLLKEKLDDMELKGLEEHKEAVEHELEFTVHVHELRSEYKRQMEERARMGKELAELKEEAQNLRQINLSGGPQTMSPGARNCGILALENMLATSSSTIVSMASHLSEAEEQAKEREQAFSGRGRWNHVQSLNEARNIMDYLFNLASSSRCQLRDKEVECRELKEKIVNVAGANPAEAPPTTAELIQKLQKLALMKHSTDNKVKSGTYNQISEEASGGWKPEERDYKIDAGLGSLPHQSKFIVQGDGNRRVGCTCSRNSLCKRLKCECRARRVACGELCSCNASKCTNREENEGRVVVPTQKARQNLASHAAMLLQSALADKPDGNDSRNIYLT